MRVAFPFPGLLNSSTPALFMRDTFAIRKRAPDERSARRAVHAGLGTNGCA